MIGFIVKHSGFGIGKIRAVENGRLSVEFYFPPNVVTLTGRSSGLKHVILPQETACSTANGQCRIRSIIPAQTKSDPHRYKVEFDDGLEQVILETDIDRFENNPVPTSPLEVLRELQLDGYASFQVRSTFAEALRATVRSAVGLRALLASRIDLRPHQAYVAGTVLMDRLPRYLLADEVGLGKTIEAGIIIHDLLEQRPSAKILIICPGTLAQQWLSELYSKFSGRVFSLLDLHQNAVIAGNVPSKTIASYSSALALSSQLSQTRWDLLVIDEAHRLLASPSLYQLALGISKAAPGCLLLSAIPARHRENEYLRLLELLEPGRYSPGTPQAINFKDLYDRQADLGRKLSYISRRLEDTASGTDRVIEKLKELLSLPVLVLDDSLASAVNSLAAKPDTPVFAEEVRRILHHIGDRYRINRRILRNRRSQLLDSEPDLNIERILNRIPFEADQLELDAANAVRAFVKMLRVQKAPHDVLLPLARWLYQSMSSPDSLVTFVELAEHNDSSNYGLESDVAYQNWSAFASSLWNAVGIFRKTDEFIMLLSAASRWKNGGAGSHRTEGLIRFLREKHKQDPERKFIIFAGFPGLCPSLHKTLVDVFKVTSVACFGWEMDDRIKEKEVLRFNRDKSCWLIVSDETGGEGRNFQFVDELIHFDLPWHVSMVEQRIGRLDRLGRTNPIVCSNVIHSSDGMDDGLLVCMDSGFEVFTRSISGLEFALSHLEDEIVISAIDGGFDDLEVLVQIIKSQSEKERAEDESQGMLDAASLDRRSAEVFRRAQSSPERDRALEKAFCDYFEFFGGKPAIRFKSTGEFPEGIVEFRPDQIPVDMALLPAKANQPVHDHLGTFRRTIAQERPDLEFFSVGNELFDAVCATLRNSAFGRAYAVECNCTRPVWRGFEFSYVASGRKELLEQHPGLIKHLDRVLDSRPEHLFIDEDLTNPPDQGGLLALRKSFAREAKNQSWFNFTLKNGRGQLLADYYAKKNWSDLVSNAEKKARSLAKLHFSDVLEPAIQNELARINEQIRQAAISKCAGWDEEVAGLEALRNALHDWEVRLDTAGFLSVNGGIIQ